MEKTVGVGAEEVADAEISAEVKAAQGATAARGLASFQRSPDDAKESTPLSIVGNGPPAVTMLTTTRNSAVEHAEPVRTCKPLRAFPRDLRVRHDSPVIPARVLTAAALLFLPLVTAACLPNRLDSLAR